MCDSPLYGHGEMWRRQARRTSGGGPSRYVVCRGRHLLKAVKSTVRENFVFLFLLRGGGGFGIGVGKEGSPVNT